MGIVTADGSVLTKLKGYWSEKDIYLNGSNQIVLLKPNMSASWAIDIISKYLDKKLEGWTKKAIEKVLINYVKGPNKKENKIAHQLQCSGVSFSDFSIDNPNIKPEWYHVQTHSLSCRRVFDDLQGQGASITESADILAKIWFSEYRSNPYKGTTLNAPNEVALASVHWDAVQNMDIGDLLDNLWLLANIVCTPKQFDFDKTAANNLCNADSGKVILESLTSKEWTLINRYSATPIEAMGPSEVYKFIRRVKTAADQALLYLVLEGVCLLPFAYRSFGININQVGLSELVLGESLLTGHFDYNRSNLASRLLVSCSMKSMHDFPLGIAEQDITKFMWSASKSVHTWRSTYQKPLKDYAIKNKLKEYPYADLKNIKTVDQQTYTVKWVKSNCSKEWADFITAFWTLNKAGDKTKKNTIRALIDWATEKRRFQIPYDIKPEDLRNPYLESEEVTYFEYLRDRDDFSENKRVAAWQSAAMVYNTVANSAKLPGSPVYGHKVKNPFDVIVNPFSRESGFKTRRPRIPESIVEMMIETLLEPDENNVPTYAWVQKATANHDTALVPDPDDPTKTIKVWCPSTANCLATILLTPIRGHQSRWLDQGLMDNFIFDLQTRQMVKNNHPLTEWRYHDGKTHMQKYGRRSGVLQTEEDYATGTDEFIIWISTNKTQMWSPAKKRGYPLPWPTGEELMESEDEAARAAGGWLHRAYQVLQNQIKWMQRYDPNPFPVSFEHDTADRKKINTDPAYLAQYPWFTPLFRNMANSVKDERDGHLVNIHLPISWQKLEGLFGLLAIETEKRFKKKFKREIRLTRSSKRGKLCIYNVHDLRVRGITHLLELGVPLSVVQHLVGHATEFMTFGYAKFDTPWIKEQIINAIKKKAHDVGGFDRAWQLLKDGKISPEQFLVFPKRNGDTQLGAIAEDLTAYVPIAGGICRMGGPGSNSCQVGRLYMRTYEGGIHTGEEYEEYGPTNGHCGLCRFWATGPLFLLEQAYFGNLTEFKFMELCRRRKKLYSRRNDLAILISESSSGASKYHQERELLELEDQITNATAEISIIQVDLALRAELFIESDNRLTQLREFLKENPDANLNKFELITGPIGENFDLKPEIMETSETGLIRTTMELFRLIERKAVAIPAEIAMRGAEITDQLLEKIGFQGGRMFQIRDPENRTMASSMFLNFCSYAADPDPVKGDAILQKALDEEGGINMIEAKQGELRQLADLVFSKAKTGETINWGMGSNGNNLLDQQNAILAQITDSGYISSSDSA
jgi:hypothetical protein